MRILIGLMVCAAGCAETAAFTPTENVVATSHGSQPAASYKIKSSAQAEPGTKVDVWSEGAKAENGQTTIEVTLSVQNVGKMPVAVEWQSLKLDTFNNDGGALPTAKLVSMTDPSNLTVGPGNARDIKVKFALPGTVTPDDIGGLRLRWALTHDEGQQYVQFTSFQRVPDLYYYGYDSFYDPLWGYYDPYWYPGGFYQTGAAAPIVVRR
jgi:hypothetical protein